MLTTIYYIAEEESEQETNRLKNELNRAGIAFEKILPTYISELSFIKEESLFLCSRRNTAQYFKQKGCFVVVLCQEENRGEDFSGFIYALENLCDIEPDYFLKVWQRYMDKPWHILDTKRCVIREMVETDVDDLYRLYRDPEITRYMEGLYEDPEMEREYIRNYIHNVYTYFGFGTWMVELKEKNCIIGRAGFNYRPGFKDVELGFMVGKEYQRRGYAFEVCRSILTVGIAAYGFKRVQAIVKPQNMPSIRLLKKLGFFYAEDVMLESGRYQRFLYE